MNLRYDEKTKHTWSEIKAEPGVSANPVEEDLTEIIEELITNSPQAKIVSIFYEQPNQPVQALVYADGNLNALKLTSSLKPQGNRRIAKIIFEDKSLEQAQQALAENLTAQLRSLPSENQ